MTKRFRLAPRSLKKQLLLSLLSSLLLVWGVTAYISYKQTRAEIAELFNAELAQSARVVHAFVENMVRQRALTKLWEHDKTPELFDTPILGHKYERKIAFQLRSVKEGLVLRSESAPEFALSLTRNGYSETMLDGQLWHVFSLSTENGNYVIHVGQRDDIRRQLVEGIAGQQVIGFLIALPILGVMIWWIVSRTLSPVNQVKEQLASRAAGYLQPLSVDNLPDEVLPVVTQINSLFAMLEQAFANERNFTSDASHELRTPLAGLLTQIQVAQKATDTQMRDQALQKAQQAVSRMTHTVQQLLTLSRVQHQQAGIAKQSVDVNEALIEVISDLDHAARDKRIDIELQGKPGLLINANPQLFQVLLRNLIDNAIKYSPIEGRIKVVCRREKNRLHLTVEDSGPGVADDDYQRITQRFYRCVETANSVEGSGLGLSIVQRIVALHAAEIDFAKSGLGGLKAILKLDLSDLHR
ncbi:MULTISPECIES: ATP-binding protein [Methylomonas]|uniref:histidine kinase n=2 Tax=Methylomonas TaxID=416 RepID=A0A126T326_9GAMM|nr:MULTISPECIES: ATP-binding protein [Methylomonas]AMK76491.1 histidine kinase [Methylomonas denitrificans]OAH98748.1 two-component sensor histidine kinase [Methylomonas methanica]TCV88524.1 two-component system sensor histidine kinase QseC [Methylomonas methanica]